MKNIKAEVTPTRRASPGDLPFLRGGKARVRQWLAFLPKALLAALLILAILDILARALLAYVVGVMPAGVLLRYVVVAITDYLDLPGVNFFWVEEVGEFTLAWLTLIGAGIAIV